MKKAPIANNQAPENSQSPRSNIVEFGYWCFSGAWLLVVGALMAVTAFGASHANRLTYLDSDDPFYPYPEFPKLTTPQWVGERDVEAVVILAVDDMRETPRYETFLRPILERLKQIRQELPFFQRPRYGDSVPGFRESPRHRRAFLLHPPAWTIML